MNDDDPPSEPLNNDDALRQAFENGEDDAAFVRRLTVVATLLFGFISAACWAIAFVALINGAHDWSLVFWLAGSALVIFAAWLYSETDGPGT
jgi:hypothetical protein